MKPGLTRIDWEPQMQAVKFLVDGHGGLLCATGGPHSGADYFAKLVCEDVECSSTCLLARLDPAEDHRTRYRREILNTLAARLSLSHEMGGHNTSINILSENVILGEVAAEIMVTNETDPDAYTDADREFALALRAHLEAQITDCRIVLALHQWDKAPAEAVRFIWEDILGDSLEALFARGLLVVCACTDGGRYCPHAAQMPPATKKVLLPDCWNGQDREHAKRDMARIMSELDCLEEGSAVERAHGFCDALGWRPAEVYAVFALDYIARNTPGGS